MGTYSVYPTGTTIYNKEEAWNGYTVFHAFDGAVVIDMNGNVVHMWKGLNGSPSRLVPGGSMIGTINQPVIAARFEEDAEIEIPDLSKEEMLEVDWNGNILWRKRVPQHHDYQIEGNPVGYPVPGMKENSPRNHGMLVLANSVNKTEKASNTVFLDDSIIEYDRNGEEVWRWNALDHIDEFGLTEDALAAIYKIGGDWCHVNSVSYVGENHFYDEGDERFHPENLIISIRELSIIAIIDKKTGKLVWRRSPVEAEKDFKAWHETHKGVDAENPGVIIGQHHAHIIPKGLPGEGNLLVYDNGGFSGYCKLDVLCPERKSNLKRHYSRVLEINPITWKIVWEYRYDPIDITASGLFSPLLGSVQRLENGNTLLTEGCFGRIMEVTKEHKVVWEYINDLPAPFKIMGTRNLIYRAYRVPYNYIPFLEHPEEVTIPEIDCFKYRVPGSIAEEPKEENKVDIQF